MLQEEVAVGWVKLGEHVEYREAEVQQLSPHSRWWPERPQTSHSTDQLSRCRCINSRPGWASSRLTLL